MGRGRLHAAFRRRGESSNNRGRRSVNARRRSRRSVEFNMSRNSTCPVDQKKEDRYRGFNRIFMSPSSHQRTVETDNQSGRSTSANIPGTCPRPLSPGGHSGTHSPPGAHEDQGGTETCPVHGDRKKGHRKDPPCTCTNKSCTPQGTPPFRSRSPSPNRDEMETQQERKEGGACRRIPPNITSKAASDAPASNEEPVFPLKMSPSPQNTKDKDDIVWERVGPLRGQYSEDEATDKTETCSLSRGLFSSQGPPKSKGPNLQLNEVTKLPAPASVRKETEKRAPRDQAGGSCPRQPPQQGATKDRSRSPHRDLRTSEREDAQQCERDMQHRRPKHKPQTSSDAQEIQERSQTDLCRSPENIHALALEVCKYLYKSLQKGWEQEDCACKRADMCQEQWGNNKKADLGEGSSNITYVLSAAPQPGGAAQIAAGKQHQSWEEGCAAHRGEGAGKRELEKSTERLEAAAPEAARQRSSAVVAPRNTATTKLHILQLQCLFPYPTNPGSASHARAGCVTRPGPRESAEGRPQGPGDSPETAWRQLRGDRGGP
ncbi:hypothetical protein NDU88_004021 [Pleurodeles waltl]|uniref:Uncharacterized protein n=1 Tax=Pleurodeles waltl TaxID=8319 RepID=A0AAV7LIK3_PLEWA|nr:hypothetical protein NDU88_004021 [Pleurodeles waltl]